MMHTLLDMSPENLSGEDISFCFPNVPLSPFVAVRSIPSRNSSTTTTTTTAMNGMAVLQPPPPPLSLPLPSRGVWLQSNSLSSFTQVSQPSLRSSTAASSSLSKVANPVGKRSLPTTDYVHGRVGEHGSSISDDRDLRQCSFSSEGLSYTPSSEFPHRDVRQEAVSRLYQFLELPSATANARRTEQASTANQPIQSSRSLCYLLNSNLYLADADCAWKSAQSLKRLEYAIDAIHASSGSSSYFYTTTLANEPSVQSISVTSSELGTSVNVGGGMYTTAVSCEHTSFRKRLRVKKGYIYYVCHYCGAKWRAPTQRMRLLTSASLNAVMDDVVFDEDDQ